MEQAPTRVVMTLMVRNERDIVAAMVEHHLAQGIDHLVVTDNGSDDGTREILAEYARVAPLTVIDDPRRNFPQAEVVTSMARLAATEFGAAWVLNADADEFWVAEDPSLTIGEALATASPDLGSFTVPVVNMLGRPVVSGSVFSTHVWRDERDESALEDVGLHAQPTHNLVHAGAPDVDVAHGNHFSSLPVANDDDVPTTARLRTYHYPWRTWTEYRARTRATGAAHERSGRQPSPRHHIMRDYRWDRAGILEPFFVARHPRLNEADELLDDGFSRDDRIAKLMDDLDTRALLPTKFGEARSTPVILDPADEARLRAKHEEFAPVMLELERLRVDEVTSLRLQNDGLREELGRRILPEDHERVQLELLATHSALGAAQSQIGEWTVLWQALRRNPVGRLALRVNGLIARFIRVPGASSDAPPPSQ